MFKSKSKTRAQQVAPLQGNSAIQEHNVTATSNLSKNYLIAQLIFWGGYWLLNLVYMGLYHLSSNYFLVLFFMLSLLMGIASHLMRNLYHQVSQRFSVGVIGLNLIWLLPVVALLVNASLSVFVQLLFKILPSFVATNQTYHWSDFFVYSINICIILILWSILYLLRAEFKKRRNSEIAHWKLQAQLKENELQFLRSQINSHFLFNAINNLRALIKEDAERARTGLADLSILLRGLLHNDGNQLVTLSDEIAWVKGYLSLEALQLENRLQTQIHIDESLLGAKLPSLVLQTLVENAIKHGIAARRNGGNLTINIYRLNETHWRIDVVNPLPEFHPQHAGNKIGLRNARERLALAFGDKARLDLQIAEQVTASVELPL